MVWTLIIFFLALTIVTKPIWPLNVGCFRIWISIIYMLILLSAISRVA